MQHLLPLLDHGDSLAMMEGLGCQQADTTVVMVVVVPLEKGLTETPGIFHRAKVLGKLVLVFKGLELDFGERVVVRDMGPTVA